MRQFCTVRAEGLQECQEDEGLDCISQLGICLCLQSFLVGWAGLLIAGDAQIGRPS